MPLTADEDLDLVTTTQKELGRMRFTLIANDIQEYVAARNIFRRERTGFSSGYGIQFNVMTATSGAAKDTGLFEVDDVNISDVMKTATIPWRHMQTSYAIERREIAMNRNPARIVELVQVRRTDAMLDLVKHFERRFWSKPASSSDELRIYGIDYWLVYNATEGFNGGTPSGYSDVAGLSTTTYDQWRNYSGQYTTVSDSDLIAKMRKAATFCRFVAPVDISDYNEGDRFGYYTNYDVIGTLEQKLTEQNSNLGNDIASKDGSVMFRRTPVTWVPHLESNTADPVYGINWGVMRLVFLTGEFMNELGPDRAPNQHTVFQTFVDTTCNVICYDRRRNFLLAKSDPTA